MGLHHNAVRCDVTDGIATLTLAMPKVNKIDESFGLGLQAALEEAVGTEGLRGIIVASANRDFCVGADIDGLFAERDAATMYQRVRELQGLFRALETAGVPVVAALTGTALGGGFELALSCHRRIALDDPRVQLGLPEVNLGVLPGAGGTQRLPRLIGLQAGLEHIAMGKIVRAPKAVKVGLVDELADTPEAVMEAARAWIEANPKATAHWDARGFRAPGPWGEKARQIIVGAQAMIYKKSAGAFPAVESIVQVVWEGSQLSFDRALELEARAFTKLAVSDQAKDMIRTFWFHKNAVEKGEGLPVAKDHGISKVTVLGAGMMGAGLGWICAKAGWEVVLKDISQDALDAAQKHLQKVTAKRMKHVSSEERAAFLSRMTLTLEYGPAKGSDLVIEAVVENPKVKAIVTQEIEPLLADGAIFASNTSALPISDLAKASAHPENFVGWHFFSPVEQMPLIELIRGEQTSEETLARSVAASYALKKLPILVNDGYGFFTSRVFACYLMEAAQLVAEGHDPVLIEWAAKTAGMVVPPLKVFDEVTLSLGLHASEGAAAYIGSSPTPQGLQLVRDLVAAGRTGKAGGAGFYDYPSRTIWKGLSEFQSGEGGGSVAYLQRRLLLAQAVQVVACLEEGILRHERDAEVGAIFGIGWAPNTGGPLAWLDRQGLPEVVAELHELAATAGERFTPPRLLVEMAEKGERFWET